MQTVDIHLPKLFDTQIEIIQHPARFKTLACGRRYGKTVIGKELLIDGALQGMDTAYFTLTRKNATKMWEEVTQAVAPVIAHKNETERRLKLITGGFITVWSLDKPVASRGQGLDRIVWDEVAYTRNARKIWERIIRPFLAFSEGDCAFLSSPNGSNNFFHDVFMYGQDPVAYPEWKSWNYPTWANPHISALEMEAIRASTSPDAFNIEYAAQFTAAAGLIYPNFTTENITTEADYQPGKPIVWGVDDGYAHGQGRGTESYHPRIILLGQETGDGGMDIFAEYVRAGVADYNDTIDEVLAWPYPASESAYIDSSAAMFKGALWHKNIFTVGATHTVSEGIKNVRRMVCDGNGRRLLRIHPRCTETIYEFGAYRANENASAQGGELKPVKCDDHTMDALRYMTWHLRYEQS